jgi:hypothetical protein
LEVGLLKLPVRSSGAARWFAMARLPPARAIWFAILCRKTIAVVTTIASNTTIPNTPAFFGFNLAMGFNGDFMWRVFVCKSNDDK